MFEILNILYGWSVEHYPHRGLLIIRGSPWQSRPLQWAKIYLKRQGYHLTAFEDHGGEWEAVFSSKPAQTNWRNIFMEAR